MKPLHAIAVEVETAYLEGRSAPAESRFVFAYTITIRNEGEVAARLLNRHWIITDATEQVQEVRGEGVVGQQPLIAPGESFRYTSATQLATPVGIMQGSYAMVAEDGHRFDATVPAFRLSVPHALH